MSGDVHFDVDDRPHRAVRDKIIFSEGPPPLPKMNIQSQPTKMAPMPNMTEIYDESSFSSNRKKSDGNANGSRFYDQSAAQKFWERVKSPDYYGPVFSR